MIWLFVACHGHGHDTSVDTSTGTDAVTDAATVDYGTGRETGCLDT